jgi:hypothetical protein
MFLRGNSLQAGSHGEQWLSQPDDLVPLCKFQSLSLFSSLEILIVLIVYKHGNIYIAVWNRRAGYVTDGEMRACSGEIQFRISARNVRFSKYEMSIITCMVLFTTFVQTKFRLYSLHYFSKYNIFKQTFN